MPSLRRARNLPPRASGGGDHHLSHHRLGCIAVAAVATIAIVGCGGATSSATGGSGPSIASGSQPVPTAATPGVSPSASGSAASSVPASAPAQASLPSHGRIAFGLETASSGGTTYDVVTIEPDGSGFQNLTATVDPAAGAPAWAPDGGHIVFAMDASSKASGHILIALPDGTDGRFVTDGPVYDDQPIVSPNGRRIAFVRHLADGTSAVAIVPTGGGLPVIVVTTRTKQDDLNGLSYSPDGARLAYVLNGGLFTIGTDGSNRVRLTPDDAHATQPRWSPDGKRILFANPDNTQQPDGRQVRIVNANGGGLGTLTALKPDSWAGDSTWSPDGSYIAYVRFVHGTGYVGLVVAAADGSNPVEIWHPAPFTDTFPSGLAWGIAR